jgi:hypothetical protein
MAEKMIQILFIIRILSLALCGIRECRLTSGQVKTPAELQNKIKQLDDMYRPKIDTTLAPIEYEMPSTEQACTGDKQSACSNYCYSSTKTETCNSNSSPSVGSSQATVKLKFCDTAKF